MVGRRARRPRQRFGLIGAGQLGNCPVVCSGSVPSIRPPRPVDHAPTVLKHCRSSLIADASLMRVFFSLMRTEPHVCSTDVMPILAPQMLWIPCRASEALQQSSLAFWT